MNQIEFYDRLNDSVPETMEVSGKVLMSKNSSKWHLCKKKASSVGHACGSGAPLNPNNELYPNSNTNYTKTEFTKSTDVSGVREALEHNRMCKNCERILEDEFDLERMTIAVPSDPAPDAMKGIIERFVRKMPDPKS